VIRYFVEYLKSRPWVLLKASDHRNMTSLDWHQIGDIFSEFERTCHLSNHEMTGLNTIAPTLELEDIFSQFNCDKNHVI
jgi:hypothetical protein